MWFHLRVESNEQTELKSRRDRLIDGEQMTAMGRGRLGGGRIKRKGKGLVDMEKSVVFAGVGYEGVKW